MMTRWFRGLLIWLGILPARREDAAAQTPADPETDLADDDVTADDNADTPSVSDVETGEEADKEDYITEIDAEESNADTAADSEENAAAAVNSEPSVRGYSSGGTLPVPPPGPFSSKTPGNLLAEPYTCRMVVLSDRAYSAICAEVLHRHPNESGGLFLGQHQDGVWYVVEATDPGIRTSHSTVYHRMDEDYLNHIYPHLSRMYRNGLDLLGLWHRHPDSMDRFSGTDMETNATYANLIGCGTLSMLVNLDPNIRLTCYWCGNCGNGQIHPRQIPVLVGDRHFAGTDFLSTIYPDRRIEPVLNKRVGSRAGTCGPYDRAI